MVDTHDIYVSSTKRSGATGFHGCLPLIAYLRQFKALDIFSRTSYSKFEKGIKCEVRCWGVSQLHDDHEWNADSYPWDQEPVAHSMSPHFSDFMAS